MSFPTVSVVMPIFNGESFLKESINSILSQTYQDFELIIINDGSTDRSLSIINEFSKIDDRIVVISRENRGLVATLNEGIAVSRGKYIARMDADDIAYPARLETQVCYFECHNNTDILGGLLDIFGDVDGELKKEVEKGLNRDLDLENLEEFFLKECPIPHPSVMMKKSVIEDLNGYNPEYVCAEDYDLWLRALKKGYNIRKLKEKVIHYRMHQNSKSVREGKEAKLIQYAIRSKLDYLNSKYINDNSRYIIWGASNGGMLAYDLMLERFPNAELVAFIDKFKEGTFLDKNIQKPGDLQSLDFNYAIIATSPGKTEAEQMLSHLGLRNVINYISFY